LVAVLWALLFHAISWPITMTKRVGLAFGCMTYVVFCCQFLLSARLKWLDRLVSQDRLLVLHGVMAAVGLGFVFAHGVLVSWGDTGKPGTLAEVGEFARLFFVLTVVGGAVLLGTVLLERVPGYMALRRMVRSGLRLRYHWCVWGHNIALVGATAMLVHVFLLHAETMLPFKVACATLYALCIGAHGYHRLLRPMLLPLWRCTKAVAEAPDVRTLSFAGGEGQELSVVPGQFAYLSIHDSGLREFHPFTIAGGSGNEVQFSIKAVGDWTRKLADVQVGDEALIHGPFGAFTSVAVEPDSRLLMIAGGIGITPFLAMIRGFAETDSARRITLVWSVRTEADAFARDELDELASRLPNLRAVVHITDGEGGKGWLDEAALAGIVGGSLDGTEGFLCGPPAFMAGMAAALRGLGLPGRRIHAERFAY
jgi:predicted ferric reductase